MALLRPIGTLARFLAAGVLTAGLLGCTESSAAPAASVEGTVRQAPASSIVAGTGDPERSSPASSKQIIIDGSEVELTMPDLSARAELSAVVRITGVGDPHWNNLTNTPWTSDDPFTRTPLIYRDADAEIVRVLEGSLSGERFSIRTVGGQVGDVEVIMDSEATLSAGKTYLLFLKRTKTPTEDGAEEAWTVVGGAQGVFASVTADEWKSVTGLTVRE